MATQKEHYIARIPRLIDIAEHEGTLVFVVINDGKVFALPQVTIDGVAYQPPHIEHLSWADFGLPTFSAIESAFESQEDPFALLKDLVVFLQPLAAMPKPEYVGFLAAWVMLTYLTDGDWGVEYSGVLYLYGDRERGKTRLLKALAQVANRSNLTETVHPASLFRFSERLAGTLLLDVSEFWAQVKSQDAGDILLARFERGHRVHRVMRPDAEPFQDVVHYQVFGPTAIATNTQVPPVMHSRCFPVAMPLRAGIYSSGNIDVGRQLRARLLAFRARMFGLLLPGPAVVGTGRWQDIAGPITQIANLMPPQVLESVRVALDHMLQVRGEQGRDSLEAQVVQCLVDLEVSVTAGRLQIKLIRDLLDVGVADRYKPSPQRVGRVLSAFGFQKTQNRLAIYWDQTLVDGLRRQYGV